MEHTTNTWPWYIAGPLIGLFVPFLLIAGNKLLGISSSFLHICSITMNTKKFSASGYDSEKHGWKFWFVVGITIGALISNYLISSSPVTFLPSFYYTPSGLMLLLLGGFLVGFGTRYANGCTSGHTISGISTLQLSGLVATICFFAGGLIYTYLITPLFQ